MGWGPQRILKHWAACEGSSPGACWRCKKPGIILNLSLISSFPCWGLWCSYVQLLASKGRGNPWWIFSLLFSPFAFNWERSCVLWKVLFKWKFFSCISTQNFPSKIIRPFQKKFFKSKYVIVLKWINV